MDFDIAAHQLSPYRVATPVFEGPLDLLLQLIERAELDITRLALAQVTDQYLAYLHTLQDHIAEEASAFLIIAAKLIQIKSEALLPRPPHREEGEEDPGEALARQLIQYKKFKCAAEYLAHLDELGLRTYLRLSSPPRLETSLDLSGVSLEDLIDAARSVFTRSVPSAELKTVVSPSPITIRQKISQIISQLRLKGKATFYSFIRGARSRLEIVVTFLAMLELVKRHHIEARQEKLFGEIELEPADQLNLDEEFELEFGE